MAVNDVIHRGGRPPAVYIDILRVGKRSRPGKRQRLSPYRVGPGHDSVAAIRNHSADSSI